MPDGEIGEAIVGKYFHPEEWEKGYCLRTAVLRRISKYTGLSFTEALELPYSYFLLLNKESWINSYMQSEQGMGLLKTLWRLKQTKADTDAVHRFQGRGEI